MFDFHGNVRCSADRNFISGTEPWALLARMATPGTWSALDHGFGALSIKHGSSPSSPEGAGFCSLTAKDASTQKASLKCPQDIKSAPALPYQWEQFLDLKTGELYYIDRSVCKQARNDTRELLRLSEDSLRDRLEDMSALKIDKKPANANNRSSALLYDYSEVEDSISDIESTDEDTDGSAESHQIINPDKQALQKLELDHEQGGQDSTVLVATGCRRCLMYYMLPKCVHKCPKCGSMVLHFSESSNKQKGIDKSNVG